MEVSGQLHAPGRFTPGTHWIVGWVGSRVGLDAVEYRKISCRCQESNIGRPDSSSSPYRLDYPGSVVNGRGTIINNVKYFNFQCENTLRSEEKMSLCEGLVCPSVWKLTIALKPSIGSFRIRHGRLSWNIVGIFTISALLTHNEILYIRP
jgi:hypothetical protein